MRHGNHRALILVEVLFEPVDALGVEVVGRFVEQQHVGLLQQQAAQGHAAALTAREVGGFLVGWRAAQGVHGAVEARVEVPGIGGIENVLQLTLTGEEGVHLVLVFVVFGQTELLVDFLVFGQCVDHVLHALLHNFAHGLVVVEVRVLRQVTHGVAGREYHFALVVVVEAGNDFHQRRLTRAVQTDDADFCAVEKAEVDVFENLLVVLLDGLRESDHRKNDFLVVDGSHYSLVRVMSVRPALSLSHMLLLLMRTRLTRPSACKKGAS